MSKIFETVGMRRPKSSAFDLSHERKLSCKMGELIPTFVQEILPGDQFMVSAEIMARFAPMIAPIQHRVNVHMEFFFVPNRILWPSWEDFITGGPQGTSSAVLPTAGFGGSSALLEGELGDYMGLPPIPVSSSDPYVFSQMPFRAYAQIFNDYYRDETLDTELDITLFADYTKLRKRRWEKDYFTSCLPFAQRGPEVDLPLEFSPQYKTQSESPNASGVVSADGGSPSKLETPTDPVQVVNLVDPQTGLSVTINDIRESSALQRWLEKQARGGYRYIETILSHFGVKSSDARLQRAEYLGGGRQPMVISEVLNTSATATEAQGNMAGHGISVGNTNSFKKRFEEHGYVIGIMSVLPRTAYQQGVNRMWKKFTKTDYFWPEFAHLGEQEVLNSELYHDPADGTYNDATFGYQQRYAEYKYGCSSVHGEYRTSLDFWHEGRIFSSQPNLNTSFLEVDSANLDRIFAVLAKEQLYVQIFNSVKARRPIPYFADPSLR